MNPQTPLMPIIFSQKNIPLMQYQALYNFNQMKAFVILLLFTLSLYVVKTETEQNNVVYKTFHTLAGPRARKFNLEIPSTRTKKPIFVTKKYCDECAKKGFCPVECAKFYKNEKKEKEKEKEEKPTKVKHSTFCEKCEKEGNCPLICKQFFIKKHERECEECEKKNYCPIDCKDYFIKKYEKKCAQCEKKGYCPLECKKYFIKKNEPKEFA